MYYTTLNKIREHRPCRGLWSTLLRYLDKTGPDDEPLSLLTILESNGIRDAVWVLRAVDDPACERDASLFAVRCVRQVQHLLRDQRSLDALDMTERYAVGMATDNELRAARTAAERAKAAANPAAVLRLVGMVRRMKMWAEAECATRRHYMGILYNILRAIDNAGLEIATPKSVFEKANSLQDVADAARKAVEEEA